MTREQQRFFKVCKTVPVAVDLTILITFMLVVFALIVNRFFRGTTVAMFECVPLFRSMTRLSLWPTA